MGNLGSQLRNLTKRGGKEALNISAHAIIQLGAELNNLGLDFNRIPTDLTTDTRRYDVDFATRCRKQIEQLRTLRFRRGSDAEKRRQQYENMAREIYAFAVLPLIGQLSQQLGDSRESRKDAADDRELYESLQRDSQKVTATDEIFASLEQNVGSTENQIGRQFLLTNLIGQAQSLLRRFDTTLLVEIDALVLQHGASFEIGSVGSIQFAPAGTARSQASLSDNSLGGLTPAARRVHSFGQAESSNATGRSIGF
jgi:hypothetical protein